VASGDAGDAYEDAADYRFNPFDITKVWPHADHPPIPIGRLVLDRNPENFFAEVEQAAFAPSNLVPGIGPSPDKMLMGRMFSYPDTHRYRIGPNYNQLPINSPHAPVRSYEIDGPMHYRHTGPEPTYAPNSRGGPQADERRAGEPTWWSDGAELGRYAYERHAGDDDFGQAGTLVRDVMTHVDRDHLVENIVDHLSQGVSGPIQDRAIDYWTCVDAPLGERVAAGLGRAGRAAA
jgi:catalase